MATGSGFVDGSFRTAYSRSPPSPVKRPGVTWRMELYVKPPGDPGKATVKWYGAPPAGAPLGHLGTEVATQIVDATEVAGRWGWSPVVPDLPYGTYVAHASTIDFLPTSVIVVPAGTVVPPISQPRWLPVVSTNMDGDRPASGHTWFWIYYDPAKPRREHPGPIRIGTPWTVPYDAAKPYTTGRQTVSNSWVHAITSRPGTFFREPMVQTGGHLSTVPTQRYNQSEENSFRGDMRGGKRGSGRPGVVVDGRAFRDRLHGLNSQGTCLIMLDGEVIPSIGKWLKPGMPFPRDEGDELKYADELGNWQCPAGLSDARGYTVSSDQKRAYIADSKNNRILAVDLTTNPPTVSHLAGRYLDPAKAMCVHSAYKADMTGGQLDGPGDQADFGHPLGVLLTADEKTLLIGDDHNCAIRKIDLATRVVSTLVQSAHVMPHTMMDLSDAGISNARATMETDGAFGVAKFHHVGKMAWDSEGNIIAAVHHSFVVRKFDLANRTTRKLFNTLFGSRNDMRPEAWVHLDVDRLGLTGVKDTIYLAGWWASSECKYLPKPDGTYVREPLFENSPPAYPRGAVGPARCVQPGGYARSVFINDQAYIVVADSAGGNVKMVTARRPTDPGFPPPRSPHTKYEDYYAIAGRMWGSRQPNGDPPRMLMHGTSNQLGFLLPTELGAMDDAELSAALNLSQYPPYDAQVMIDWFRVKQGNERMPSDTASAPDEEDPAVIAQLQAENAALRQQLTAEKKRADDCDARCSTHEGTLHAVKHQLEKVLNDPAHQFEEGIAAALALIPADVGHEH